MGDTVPIRTTVVIPVADGRAAGHLIDAVRSLREQEAPARIVVVDNASRATLPVLPGVTVVRSRTRLSVAEARSLGLARTMTPYVIFWDAADLMLPGTLASLEQAIMSRPGLVAFAQATIGGPAGHRDVWPPPWIAALTRRPRLFAALTLLWPLYPVGGATILRTDVVRDAVSVAATARDAVGVARTARDAVGVARTARDAVGVAEAAQDVTRGVEAAPGVKRGVEAAQDVKGIADPVRDAKGFRGDEEWGADWELAVALALRGRLGWSERPGRVRRVQDDSPASSAPATRPNPTGGAHTPAPHPTRPNPPGANPLPRPSLRRRLAGAAGVGARLQSDPRFPAWAGRLLPLIRGAQYGALLAGWLLDPLRPR